MLLTLVTCNSVATAIASTDSCGALAFVQDIIYFLTQQKCWHCLQMELLHHILQQIDIDSGKFHIWEFLSKVSHGRFSIFTRLAPCCGEIDHHLHHTLLSG
eukprot:TRINITY_DN39621_c0_g1_i3.p1 TRINITY_DN39621_c0_g1~~TRINITY_DN39621_c0_g1_i3.p1  ORF type:complete len:101 (-),score=12.30 TRINITY_DN39621_c0_g1_i3:269-571(-)